MANRYEFISPAVNIAPEGTIQSPADAPTGPKTGRYDAVQSTRYRMAKTRNLSDEDQHLDQNDRDKLQTTVMDEERNYANLGWALRLHLNWVAFHTPAAKTGDKTLDEDLEGILEEAAEPDEFDERGRFDREDFIRTGEACRTIAGDVFFQKLDNGRLQAIEADRVRNPPDQYSDRWRNGVLQTPSGRATHYSIWKRTARNGFEFETILPADQIIQFGYFKRFDQARGITPLASALNTYRDTAKGIELALARMKLDALFGAVFNVNDPNYSEVKLTDGPFLTEMGLEEKAELLTSHNPSGEFAAFMETAIAIALKSLDIPYSFYKENFANFFGNRAAANLYMMSCKQKRRSVVSLRRNISRWRFNYEISRKRLRLPRSIPDVNALRIDWIPQGVPWWNPVQEANAAKTLIELKMASRQELRRETHGDDWYDLFDRIGEEEDAIASRYGVPGTTAEPGDAGCRSQAELLAEIQQLRDELEMAKVG